MDIIEYRGVGRDRESGGRRGEQRGKRRGAAVADGRLATLALALVVTLPLAGCATKKDMRLLRNEILLMQQRQDSLYRQLGSAIMDTMNAQSGLIMRVRGDLAVRLLAMEEQLIQIQELTGQGQLQLGELRRQMEERSQAAAMVGPPDGAVVTTMSEDEIEQTFLLGRQKLEEGSINTARAAFTSILSGAPTHPLAPEAQLQIAETYVAEEKYTEAFEEFEKVLELFANTPQAPMALYRAGILAKEQGDNAKARTYFTRVQSGYAQSDEARLASEELSRLPRR